MCTDYTQLVFGIAPAAFAFLILLSTKYEDEFIDHRAGEIYIRERLGELRREGEPATREGDLDLQAIITAVAKSSVVVKNHVTTIFSTLISAILAFQLWPDRIQFVGSILVLVLFASLMYKWIWTIFAKDLMEIALERGPAKRRWWQRGRRPERFESYTYAQQITRREKMLQIALILILATGYVLKNCNLSQFIT